MKIKTLGTLIVILGLFAVIGTASASTADTLQPASVITYNDELIVNNTGRFDSAYIGKQGVGGVTFFNGTIINVTTDADSGDEIPVTFGDDVRIDGSVWRGETVGAGLDDNREFKVDDDMIVAGDLSVGGLVGTGIVNSTNILNGAVTTTDLANDSVTSAKINNGTVATEDLANNAITSAKISNGTITGSDISSSADLSVDTGTFAGAVTTGALSSSTGTFSGAVTAQGDITQGRTDHGTLKAQVFVDGDGDCTTLSSYNWTFDNSSISCTKHATGTYAITFGFTANDRLAQATALNGTSRYVTITPGPGATQYTIYGYDGQAGGSLTDTNFFFTLF